MRAHLVASPSGVAAIGPLVVREVGNSFFSVTNAVLTIDATGHQAGNTILVAAVGQNTLPATCVDSKGNTYVRDVNVTPGTIAFMAVFRATNITALVSGDTVTVGFGSSNSSAAVGLLEVTHLTNTSPLDQSATGSNSSAVTGLTAGPTSTTTQAAEIAIGAFCASGTTGAVTVGSGFIGLTQQGGVASSNRQLVWGYKVLSTLQAVTSTFTLTTARGYAGAVLTYKGV